VQQIGSQRSFQFGKTRAGYGRGKTKRLPRCTDVAFFSCQNKQAQAISIHIILKIRILKLTLPDLLSKSK
jgi:hypothetical protein